MLFYIIGLILFIIVFHIFIYHRYNWPRYIRMLDMIPGPRGIFFFGSTITYWTMANEELVPYIRQSFRIWGSTFKLWFSGIGVVFVSDISDVQTVLSTRLNSEKGLMYKNILPWLGTGLLTSSGEKWHMRRKIITPAFHFSKLQDYIEVFNRNSKVLINILDREKIKQQVDLGGHLTLCALDIICEAAMGTKVESQLQKHSDYVQALLRLGKVVIERMFSPILFTDHNFAMSMLGREFRKLLKVLHSFTTRIIEEKKQLRAKENIYISSTEENNIAYSTGPKTSFLEMLLDKAETYHLTDKDIREEVDTFMFEGHDTTSAALTWTLFELGHHQDIQDGVYDELHKIFGDSDREPTYQDLTEMHYLKRVVQETLRLYPSVPIISRKFDVDLQLSEYTIPAGTEVVLLIYHIHRNPTIFQNPEEFNPDHFLPEVMDKRHPFAYIPFSAGQRNCVGQRFAMLEELVILSTIIRKYKVESLDKREEVKVVPELTLRPFQKLKMRITDR